MMKTTTSKVLRRGYLFTMCCFFFLLNGSLFCQEDNPFNIKARTGVSISDTLSSKAKTPTPDASVSFVEKKQIERMNENPFNVSHIPIRRSKAEPLEKPKPENTQPAPKESIVEKPTAVVQEHTEKMGQKFLFWFFLLQLLLITSILGINREFIRKVSRSISNDNFAKLIARDYNNGSDALFAILYLLFLLSLTTFVYLASQHFFQVSGFSRFLVLFLAVSAIYIVRHFFLGFMSFVFPFARTVKYYGFMIILFNSYLGLLLIPINVVIAYSPSIFANLSIYIGIGLIAIMYLLRLLRGSLHAYTFIRNNIFHFFLYLCTCEIAPIFIMVRFLSNSFGN